MVDEQEGSFKVTDRRLFNADGSLRDDVPAEQAPTPVVTPTPTPSNSPASAAAPAPQEDELNEIGEDEMTEFMEVVMDLAAPAFIHLGMAEHPATGKPEINLPAAHQAIDRLRVLREKTQGNLTNKEEQFFDGVLADLQMQFVSMRQ